MSKGTLGQVVKRAISDAAFRRELQANPDGALKGFDLTSEERAALRSGDASKLSTFGIDQRMSKAFTLGEGAAAASRGGSRSELSDSSAARSTFIDQDSGAGNGRAALLDDAGGSVRSGLTSDGAGARTALDDQHGGGRAAIGDNAASGRAALDNSGTASREGSAFITADEMGNDVVAGGSVGAQSSLDVSGQTRDTSASIDAAAGRQGDAFMTADEMGNDVSASGSSHPSLSAAQRLAGETLEADVSPTDAAADPWAENPEHHG